MGNILYTVSEVNEASTVAESSNEPLTQPSVEPVDQSISDVKESPAETQKEDDSSTETQKEDESPAETQEKQEEKKYIKFICKDYKNYELEFKIGRVVDPEPFNSAKECGVGGIYFCTWDQAASWAAHSKYLYAADIEIPPTAQVVHMYDKSKADMIDIKSIVPITEHPIWLYGEFANRVLKDRSDLLPQLRSIPVDSLTQHFVERHAEWLIGRSELTEKHYMWIAAMKPCLTSKFPPEYKNSVDFWNRLIEECPNTVKYSPFLTMEQARDLFFRPNYLEDIGSLCKETDSMRFLTAISLSSSNMRNYTDEEFLLLCKWRPINATYIPHDRLTPEMTDLILASPYASGHIQLEVPEAEKCVSAAYQQNKEDLTEKFGKPIADAVHAYVEKTPFLKKLTDAKLLKTIYGGFIREVIMCVLENSKDANRNVRETLDKHIETYLDTADIDIIVTPPEIVTKSEEHYGRRTRRINKITYDLTEVVDIVKQLNGAIEFYSSKYGEESPGCSTDVKSASAGTYVVWIPIEEKVIDASGSVADVNDVPTWSYDEAGPSRTVRKYRKYDLNIGSKILTNDTLLNSLTYDCAEKCIEGMNNKGIFEVLQNRDIAPAELKQPWNYFGSAQGKMLMRVSKLFARGYKVSKHFGLLYHLQILMCRGFVSAYDKLSQQKGSDSYVGSEWINYISTAYTKKTDADPADYSFKVSNRISPSDHKMERVTPKLVLESLSSEFVAACQAAADEWHEDFSLLERNAETRFIKQREHLDY